MPLTKEAAIRIALQAGDIHMQEAGREEWSSEDCAAATAVYEQLTGLFPNSPENGHKEVDENTVLDS